MLESTLMSAALILASNSPRRRHLLALTGREFEVFSADVDETVRPGEDPAGYVSRLAEAKARKAAAEKGGQPAIFLGFDTTVALDGQILGKPADDAEAREMLTLLRGKTHQVYTALVLYDTRTNFVIYERCCSAVPMRAYSAAEMEAYIASGDPLDKAGAYAIQAPGFNPVHDFHGCYASVMGLPLCHLERSLRRLAGPSPADVAAACQADLHYDCPIWQAVQRGESAG